MTLEEETWYRFAVAVSRKTNPSAMHRTKATLNMKRSHSTYLQRNNHRR